jgi:tetratricopeptide (TPR) repeat protein
MKKTVRIVVIVLLAIFLLSFPIRDLAADYYYRRAANILHKKNISESTLSAYREAINSLKKAAAIAPSHATSQKALSEIYTRIGLWSETMESLKAPLPPDTLPSRDAYQKAIQCLERAIYLEPTNPDYHLTLGKLYDRLQVNSQMSGRELKRAEAAYPCSAPVRQALAMQYLLSGKNGEALKQARALAEIDDTYILPESAQKTTLREIRPPEYLQMLSKSYLYSALEIAWRASYNPEEVKGITPDNPDAAQVLQLFLERKEQ